jgi:hypothetical protein
MIFDGVLWVFECGSPIPILLYNTYPATAMPPDNGGTPACPVMSSGNSGQAENAQNKNAPLVGALLFMG